MATLVSEGLIEDLWRGACKGFASSLIGVCMALKCGWKVSVGYLEGVEKVFTYKDSS